MCCEILSYMFSNEFRKCVCVCGIVIVVFVDWESCEVFLIVCVCDIVGCYVVCDDDFVDVEFVCCFDYVVGVGYIIWEDINVRC